MASESNDMLKARRELALFERNAHQPEGISHLGRGLSMLSDLAEVGPSERERSIATNLFKTYVGRAESLADHLLANAPQLSVESLSHWFDVIHEFDTYALELPDTFKSKKLAFWYAIAERLTPSERKQVIRELTVRSAKPMKLGGGST